MDLSCPRWYGMHVHVTGWAIIIMDVTYKLRYIAWHLKQPTNMCTYIYILIMPCRSRRPLGSNQQTPWIAYIEIHILSTGFLPAFVPSSSPSFASFAPRLEDIPNKQPPLPPSLYLTWGFFSLCILYNTSILDSKNLLSLCPSSLAGLVNNPLSFMLS